MVENSVYVYIMTNIISGSFIKEDSFLLFTVRVIVPRGTSFMFLIGGLFFTGAKLFKIWKYPPFGGFSEPPASIGPPVRCLLKQKVFRHAYRTLDDRGTRFYNHRFLDIKRIVMAIFFFSFSILPQLLNEGVLKRYAAFLILIASVPTWLFSTIVRILRRPFFNLRYVRPRTLSDDMREALQIEDGERPIAQHVKSYIFSRMRAILVLFQFIPWLVYAACQYISWLVFDNPRRHRGYE